MHYDVICVALFTSWPHVFNCRNALKFAGMAFCDALMDKQLFVSKHEEVPAQEAFFLPLPIRKYCFHIKSVPMFLNE